MASYDRPELERWQAQAEAAMATAATSAASSWACFLCEQAAQLLLKGLLHAVGEHDSAWGHDLVLLERRTSEVFGEDWPSGLDEAFPGQGVGSPADHRCTLVGGSGARPGGSGQAAGEAGPRLAG